MLLALLGGRAAFTITYAYLMTLRFGSGGSRSARRARRLSPIVEVER
jgi:hypothetical protein